MEYKSLWESSPPSSADVIEGDVKVLPRKSNEDESWQKFDEELESTAHDRAQTMFMSKSDSVETLRDASRVSKPLHDGRVAVKRLRQSEITIGDFPVSDSESPYVLTRMIRDTDTPGSVYAVFKKISAIELNRYSHEFIAAD